MLVVSVVVLALARASTLVGSLLSPVEDLHQSRHYVIFVSHPADIKSFNVCTRG